jgi:hypothetical protein
MWRCIQIDGCEWEVRALVRDDQLYHQGAEPGEVLEFRARDGLHPPRRLAIPPGALTRMDDEALFVAYREARPIGGDYYGRPGKQMSDVVRSQAQAQDASASRSAPFFGDGPREGPVQE